MRVFLFEILVTVASLLHASVETETRLIGVQITKYLRSIRDYDGTY